MAARSGVSRNDGGGDDKSGMNWTSVGSELDRYGCAVLPGLVSRPECDAVRAMYAEESRFRSHVIMARHGFGRGEYRYFRYPLPEIVARLRAELYPPLAAIANGWNLGAQYPESHE